MQVTPMYDRALAAIEALRKQDIEEIRAYIVPPDLVKVVFEAICVVFKEPPE